MREVTSRSGAPHAPADPAPSKAPDTVDALERRNRELLEVISVAGHDLKEPLRNLRASAQSLSRACGDSLPQDARALLDVLLDQAHRTERLVNDLLTYASLTGGPLRLEACVLDYPLQWALSNLRDRIEEEGASVTHDPLPAVEADVSRMIQVFQNLIANALTYRGSSPARVHVDARARDAGWVVSVRDAGIGVPPPDRERIFEPFARLHSESRYPGTGLGLAICRGIIEAHGGELWVEGSREGGATFAFTLPGSVGESAEAGGRSRRDV